MESRGSASDGQSQSAPSSFVIVEILDWFAAPYLLAVKFVDEWDMKSFDPMYPREDLGHFASLVRRLITGA